MYIYIYIVNVENVISFILDNYIHIGSRVSVMTVIATYSKGQLYPSLFSFLKLSKSDCHKNRKK